MSKMRWIQPVLGVLALGTIPASAVTIVLDYSLDSNNFFGGAGSVQRLALEAARDQYQNLIDQNFAAITPGGVNDWSADFFHPGTGAATSIANPTIAADTVVIYVGGQELGGSTLGQAGRGGWSGSGTPAFLDTIQRGDSVDSFGLWGGAATFDSLTNWNFSLTSGPAANQNDFYSVAVHELGHVFGLGAPSDAWDAHFSGGQFSGENAVAAWNLANDPDATSIATVDGSNRHFADGTLGFIYGTTTLQEVALDPNITTGTRKELTNVDVGALQDIGWTIVPEPGILGLAALGALAGLRRRRI